MKKLIAIYGGPRRNKNTEMLLDEVLKFIDEDNIEVEKIILRGMNISPCVSCYGCSSGKGCIIRDDMSGIYEKIKNADGIILASPIYFAGVSALAKSMIDRCQTFWSAKYIANIRNGKKMKEGYFIATAGSDDNDTFLPARMTVKLFFAACDAGYSGELLAGGTDKVSVNENTELLEKARCFASFVSGDYK